MPLSFNSALTYFGFGVIVISSEPASRDKRVAVMLLSGQWVCVISRLYSTIAIYHRASNPYASERLFKRYVFWTPTADTLGGTTSGHLVALADDISAVQIDDEVIACRVVVSLKISVPVRSGPIYFPFHFSSLFVFFRSTIPIIFGHVDVIRTAILVSIPYSHSEEVSAHRCVVNISYAFRQ